MLKARTLRMESFRKEWREIEEERVDSTNEREMVRRNKNVLKM